MPQESLTPEEKAFKKRVFRAKLVLFWQKFFTNKLALALTILGIGFTALGCVLLAWAIQGQDVGAILLSPLAMLWYVILAVVALVGGYWLLTRSGRKEQ